nr:Uncharacterised protein [Raoultella sp. NCTC 9187]
MVKVGNFFAQDKIFQQRRAAVSRAQGVLIVGDADALVGGEREIFPAFTLALQGVKLVAVRIGRFQAAGGGWLFARGCGVRGWAPLLVIRGQRIKTGFRFAVIVYRR